MNKRRRFKAKRRRRVRGLMFRRDAFRLAMRRQGLMPRPPFLTRYDVLFGVGVVQPESVIRRRLPTS